MKKLGLIFTLSMIALIAMSVLSYDESKRLKPEKISFKVTESEALYFKNLRLYYYEKETREDAGFDLLRLKKQSDECDSDTCLHFVIVDNWRNDLAYLLTSVKGDSNTDYRIRIIDVDSTEFALRNLNSEQMLQVGLEVYQALFSDESSFYLISAHGKKELWTAKKQRDQTKAILKDYFKLTGAL